MDARVETALAQLEQRRNDDVIEMIHATSRTSGDADALALLSAIQVQVGARWQDATWSVADEHAATATLDLALTSLLLDHPTPPTNDAPIVIACAEGEWHVLPTRIAALALTRAGWPVSFLGASTPADQLERYLAKLDAVALGLSCSRSVNLVGAQRSVTAAHRAGTPVLVSGAGFGADPDRASAIGADAWGVDVAAALAVLDGWLVAPPDLATPTGDVAGCDIPAEPAAARRLLEIAQTALRVG